MRTTSGYEWVGSADGSLSGVTFRAEGSGRRYSARVRRYSESEFGATVELPDAEIAGASVPRFLGYFGSADEAREACEESLAGALA
jgi:hypothetical protein